VTRLRESDFREVLKFLGEADAIEGADPFPPRLLDSLTRLIPCNSAHFCELDRAAQRVIADTFSDGSVYEYDPGEDLSELWRLMKQLPACIYQLKTGRFEAVKNSDFMTRRDLYRSEIYAARFRPSGSVDELIAGISDSRRYTKTFLFHAGRNFNERDRFVLNLLRPHLRSLYRRAGERRRATAALAALDRVDSRRRGAILLGENGRIELVSRAAHQLTGEYLPEPLGAYLPEPLSSWLRQQATRPNQDRQVPTATEPLRVEREGRRLLVRAPAPDLLLLEEEVAELEHAPASLGLTPREWDVLRCLAKGKSTAEIAQTLWVAPGTVRKHLEHIYEKLEVSGRTAAVARAFLTTSEPGSS
jgi:ATP/maltotriose-dependent transcriptional regulator MalT